jgi:hypothetical protein
MHKRVTILWVLVMLGMAAHGATKPASKPQDGQAIVIVFKDGRQQSFAMADIARIEFKGATASTAASNAPDPTPLGRGHFLGKWEVGQGNGENFFITLEASGEATKSIGSSHGTWTVENGEAHIIWDDGWRDAIRKVGTQYEKIAYHDKTFSGDPENVTKARHVEAKPI